MPWDLPRIDTKQPDLRVQSALVELGLPFEIDEDGDFRIRFSMANGRKHTGFIRTETYDFEGIELREIYSAALRSFGPFDARTMDILLQENIRLKLGLWSVAKDEEDNHIAIFKVRIPASARGQQLLAVISAVLRVADEMESRLSGRDDY